MLKIYGAPCFHFIHKIVFSGLYTGWTIKQLCVALKNYANKAELYGNQFGKRFLGQP